jgi:hypothetical protein
VEPIVSVQAALLRAQLPELVLRPGASLMARVASRGDTHAVIVLAGIPVTAQLPEDVPAGATLKLHVQEVSQERVVLRMDQATVNPAAPALAQQVPARVTVQEAPHRRPASEGGGAGVALAFESPALGRLDLRIDLATRRVTVGVAATPGQPFELARAGADRLRDSLQASTGLQADVRITQRRPPLDLYA